jgi:hypothetical protein
MMRFRTPLYRIDDVKGLRRIERNSRSSILFPTYIHTDTADLAYRIRGPDGWHGRVTASYTQRTEASTVHTVDVRGVTSSEREFDRLEFRSVQELRIDGDPQRVWRLEMSQVIGDTVRPAAATALRLRLDAEEYTVVAMTTAGPAQENTQPAVSLVPRTEGWMVTFQGRPILVVQTAAGGILGQNDRRLWLPSEVSSADRGVRTALAMMLLAVSARHPFGGDH